ncbi:MAG: RIP metalloprotease RseP [Planktotalea sp.]|uniref:RIP metalloprotease RseP n=1 Tax=Planktotalea sp. TaxID=2029877 RepID=UPI003C72AF33
MDILGLLPQFGNVIWTLLAFVLALSVIVAIHEYGHYIVGRWSGIHAEVFSLGFGPVLFSRVDKHGTVWQFAALPFGGYVKFLGDANAASAPDGEAVREMSPEEQRRTMPGAPLWARAATVAAGPIFNFALSIIVFTAIFFGEGEASDPLAVGSLREMPYEQELQVGDVLRAVDGIAVPSLEDEGGFYALETQVEKAANVTYTIERAGNTLDVAGPYPFPALISMVAPQSAALAAGLKEADVITAINGAPVYAFAQLKEAVESSDGAPLLLELWNAGETRQVTLAPKRVDEAQADNSFITQWRIGVAGGLFFEPATQSMGLTTAFSNGVSQTRRIIEGSLSGMYHMVTGAISSCNLSGPIGIAQTSGAMASQGATNFIWFIALLSTAVGLLNLFPVPVLDGGHLVFYAYEAVTGKPPSEKALRIFMTAGLVMILSLMLFALGNDLFCP